MGIIKNILKRKILDKELGKLADEIEHKSAAQDFALQHILNAEEYYKKTKDPHAAIRVYEEYLPQVGNAPTHHLFLADLYEKAGMNDKAWGYLNKMMLDDPGSKPRIRKAQFKLLKREKRWLEALHILVMYHSSCSPFNRADFEKDAAPVAKKLCIDAKSLAALSLTLEQNSHNETTAVKACNTFLKSKGLMQ